MDGCRRRQTPKKRPLVFIWFGCSTSRSHGNPLPKRKVQGSGKYGLNQWIDLVPWDITLVPVHELQVPVGLIGSNWVALNRNGQHKEDLNRFSCPRL